MVSKSDDKDFDILYHFVLACSFLFFFYAAFDEQDLITFPEARALINRGAHGSACFTTCIELLLYHTYLGKLLPRVVIT